jgi:hypothetical protein
MQFATRTLTLLIGLSIAASAQADARWWRQFADDEGSFPGRREKAAYMGVAVSRLAGQLREHVKLPHGVGLVVDKVEPGSPAESAGLKRHDVIHKLNDQLLINEHQFRVLVRTFKPGDEVMLSVFRQGDAKTISVKLAERDLPVLGEGFPWEAPDIRVPIEPDFWKDLPKPPRLLAKPHGGSSFSITTTDGRTHAVWTDAEHILILNCREDGKDKRLSAHSMSGKRLFDGPVNTEEQRRAVPGEIAGKLAKIEQAIREQSPAGESAPTTRPSDRI